MRTEDYKWYLVLLAQKNAPQGGTLKFILIKDSFYLNY